MPQRLLCADMPCINFADDAARGAGETPGPCRGRGAIFPGVAHRQLFDRHVLCTQPLHTFVQHNAAAIDDYRPLADVFNVAGVVAGKKYRHALFPVHFQNSFPQFPLYHHVQPDGGLVQKQ